ITAFIVLVAFPDDTEGTEGLIMVQQALQTNLGSWALIVLAAIMLLLAFTSVLGNYSYCEANMRVLAERLTWQLVFGAALVVLVLIGAVIDVELTWTIAGISMVFIAMINLVVITILAPKAILLLRHYSQQHADGLDPIFLASDLPELENVAVWDE